MVQTAVTLMFLFVTFRQSGSRQLSWGLLSTKRSVNSFVTIRKLLNNFKKLHVVPNVVNVRCENAMLLGAPIGNSACVDAVLVQKLDEFKRSQHRLKLLNVHDAFTLFVTVFLCPNCFYTLRSAPCFASTELVHYDTLIR